VYKDALEICGDIRGGLNRERCTMRALKAEPGYDSDGSETMDTKQAIGQYKRAAEHALLGLNNTSEVDTSVQPTATNIVIIQPALAQSYAIHVFFFQGYGLDA
jgi:hypothetical protein